MTRTTRFVRTAAIVAVGGMSAFGLAACASSAPGDSSSDGGSSDKAVTIEYAAFQHTLTNPLAGYEPHPAIKAPIAV